MNSGLNFLVAARQCEISELETLALTSELVGVIGRLVHALQRERGISNVYLASRGVRFADALQQQVAECEAVQAQVLTRLDALDTDARRVRNGARLFSRIAFVLHALEGLPALRGRVTRQTVPADEATATYTRLIAGLLNVVFEAADSATDPKISRALVALFHFLQGKEYAGQERAFGGAAYASGRIDAAQHLQWQHLIEAQEACLQVFTDFSDEAVRSAWHAHLPAEALLVQERLRRVAAAASTGGTLDPNASAAWYEACTQRIDAMKSFEDQLAANLRLLCDERIAQAHADLRDQQAILNALQRQAEQPGNEPPALLGPHLERSILGMVQEQSRRLQTMSDELETARAALNERKVIERAKGLLMASRQLSEDEAYKMLRQTAMNQGRRLVDVAKTVLAMSDYL
ncbi:MAG: nitrate- and nitrite sensing domain-containing protein [Curvibacter sp.]